MNLPLMLPNELVHACQLTAPVGMLYVLPLHAELIAAHACEGNFMYLDLKVSNIRHLTSTP